MFRYPAINAAPIRLIILDGHDGARRALAAAFRRDPAFELLAETADPAEAVQICEELQPDLALVDFRRLPPAAEVCRALRDASSVTRLVAQSAFFEPGEERRYYAQGVAACWLKDSAFRELVGRLRALIWPAG